MHSTPPTQSDALSRLPVDVLTDSLLPTFPTRDAISLARTCRQWYAFLTRTGEDSEIFWMRRCISEFNFPVRASGRRTGWFQLYSRLAQSAAYVWGQNENGRLGLPDSTFRLPNALRSRLLEGGLVLPTRLELPAPPVSIVAGGWSFHALTADGKVVSWGTLNGGSWSRDDAPLAQDGRAFKPSVLPQSDVLGPMVQLEAGRSHVVMLGRDGNVSEMRSFGRIVQVRDENRRWGIVATGTGKEVMGVHTGWDYSAVLTRGGDVYVWWEVGSARLDRGARLAGEDELDSPSTQGVVFPLDVDTLRLPPLHSPTEPDHRGEVIKLLACGDNFVIALTDHSRLFFLSLSPVPDPARPHARQGALNDPEDSPVRSRESMARLDAELLNGRRKWRLMSKFCDPNEFGKLDGLEDRAFGQDTKITHVSAHFNSFAAYSVPSSSDPNGSVVLLGDSDWHEQTEPKIIPELQGLGVIKIAQGDYHNVALTSSGQLYSWGAFSGGALGLGHPTLANTPLSITAPTTSSSSSSSSSSSIPPPRNVNNPNQPLPPPLVAGGGRQGHPLFPGFTRPPNRPVGNDRPRAPERIDRPTQIRFDPPRVPTREEKLKGESGRGQSGNNGTFVYAVTASGWHSGALAVNLDTSSSSSSSSSSSPLDEGKEGENDEDLSEPIIRLERAREATEEEGRTLEAENEANGLGPTTGGTWIGRLGRPFRIGFAGRGGIIGRGGA